MSHNFYQALIDKFQFIVSKLKKGTSEISVSEIACPTESKVETLDISLISNNGIKTDSSQLVEVEVNAPPLPLATSFIIGRRLLADHFEKDDEGNTIILMKAFLDTRLGQNLSFDSLGNSGSVERRLVNRLKPIIKKHLELTNEKYVAWAGIKRNTLPGFKVYSTPDTNPDNPNELHCDLDRTEYNSKVTVRALAHELAAYANKDKLYEATDVET